MRTREKYSLVSGRRMVFASLLLLTGVLATCTSCAPKVINTRPVGYIIVEDGLLRLMNTRHEKLKTEQVVVLFGRVEGLAVVVEGFDATHVIESTPVSARFKPHPSTRIVGILHNHPTGGCHPSETDIATLYGKPYYMVVMASCGKGRFGAVLKGDPRYHRKDITP